MYYKQTGLGCSFLSQRCTNRTIYPYLCDERTEESVCTYDHLTKVNDCKFKELKCVCSN